jgi:hypothetical protein
VKCIAGWDGMCLDVDFFLNARHVPEPRLGD